MFIGEKIRRIRIFRGMTQKELGIALGLNEKGADNRVTQYENGYRIPKSELLEKIAEVLRSNPQNFHETNDESERMARAYRGSKTWLDHKRGVSRMEIQLATHLRLSQCVRHRLYQLAKTEK